MNRRSFFSFLASVPVGIAGIAAAKSDSIVRRFLDRGAFASFPGAPTTIRVRHTSLASIHREIDEIQKELPNHMNWDVQKIDLNDRLYEISDTLRSAELRVRQLLAANCESSTIYGQFDLADRDSCDVTTEGLRAFSCREGIMLPGRETN